MPAATLDELQRWSRLGTLKRAPKRLHRNAIDSRQALKWKEIEGTRLARDRLTVCSFEDMPARILSTYAGTATKWG